MTRVEVVRPSKDVLRMLRAMKRKRARKVVKNVKKDALPVGFEAAFKLTERDEVGVVKRRREAAETQEDIDEVILDLERKFSRGEIPGKQMEKAVETLGLLYIQEDDLAGARDLLSEHGFLYRLSSSILRYPIPPKDGKATPLSRQYVTAYDNALPEELFNIVKAGFAPSSAFWTEHNYKVGVTPYFSYRHDLGGEPKTAMDQVVRRVAEIMMKDIPGARDAKYAEWWAHCRPHPDGHQLHYDADNEGKGGVRNPLANCIIFISEGCGGPTLVTTQKYGAATALSQEGWFMYPKENRIVAYPADILHGVVPGRGPVPPDARRTTLMVALWGATGCTLRPNPTPDASRPFPTQVSNVWYTNPDPTPYTWPSLFPVVSLKKGKKDTLRPAPPVPVEQIWEDVSYEDNKKAKINLERLKTMPHYDQCFQGF